MSKKTSKLLNDALGNIEKDRKKATILLDNLMDQIQNNQSNFRENGFVAAKLIEVLQKSNEQLVRITEMLKKGEKTNGDDEKISKEEQEEIYDNLNKEYLENTKNE